MDNIERTDDRGRDPDRLRDERRVADEITARLRGRGVHLTGHETDEQLVRVLEAVERFEATVERHGGDLMVDEPINTRSRLQPDDRRFALPRRHEHETIETFVSRIVEATARAAGR